MTLQTTYVKMELIMNDFNKKDPLKLFLVQNDMAPKEAPHFEYTQILQKPLELNRL